MIMTYVNGKYRVDAESDNAVSEEAAGVQETDTD